MSRHLLPTARPGRLLDGIEQFVTLHRVSKIGNDPCALPEIASERCIFTQRVGAKIAGQTTGSPGKCLRQLERSNICLVAPSALELQIGNLEVTVDRC